MRARYGIYERKGSKFVWIYYYTEGDPKRRQECSKQSVNDPLGRKHALEMAKEKAGELSAPASRLQAARWDDWVDDWLTGLYPDAVRQAKTLRTAQIHWGFIRAYLHHAAIEYPAGVSYNTGIEYLRWRKTVRRTPKHALVQTAAKEVSMLRRVMTEAKLRGFIGSNPLLDLVVKTPKPKEKPEISPQEEVLIRAELAKREGLLPLTERWMTIAFEIAIRHGWRIAETSFPLSRIDFTNWKVMVHQKGDRWRTVPVHPELRPLFMALRDAGATVSCTFPKNHTQRASYAWSLFFVGCERDGVKGILPHLCFHCCRVTVISRMARAGVPERLCMEWVGHASTAVHRIYQRVRSDDLEKCIFPSGTSIVLPASHSPQT